MNYVKYHVKKKKKKRCEKEQHEIPCEKECETEVTRPEMHGL